MSELRDWAGLPDGLLHSIVELLRSFHDLLAFAATCHPWRSAFSSYPSKATLYTSFPPLLLDPNVSFCSPRPFPNVARNTSVPKRPCYVIDLASQDSYFALRFLCFLSVIEISADQVLWMSLFFGVLHLAIWSSWETKHVSFLMCSLVLRFHLLHCQLLETLSFGLVLPS
jgi:hypothetical protein